MSKFKRTLGIALTASLIGLGGCSSSPPKWMIDDGDDGTRGNPLPLYKYEHPEYAYDELIGDEHVRYWEEDIFLGVVMAAKLETKKYGETIVRYIDFDRDLKLNVVFIRKDGKDMLYRKNAAGKPILKEAQKKFDGYLANIKEVKIKRGLEAISE